MFILDTDTISEGNKPRPSSSVARWMAEQAPDRVFVSVMTIGELRKGVAREQPGPRRDRLAAWFAAIAGAFSDRILDFDVRAAVLWGDITGDALRRGEPLPVVDSQIASIALREGFTVVTRNVRHYLTAGVPVLNPWEGTP